MKSTFLSALAVALLAGRANADAPSYTKDVKPFLKTYCLECHGGRETKKGISVDSYAALMKAGRGRLVVPENPEKSRLVLVMTGGGKQMPPRKFGKQPTRDEIALIKAWIAAGARDDSDNAKPAQKGDGGAREEASVPRRGRLDPHGTTDE
jgi:mono/diheme cytochrome c family protein